MLKQHAITSAEDFAKLAEETERLVQHVEDVRQRMAALAKKRQSRPDLLHVLASEAQQAPSKTEPPEASASETKPPPASASSASAVRRPSSGVFPVMPDRDGGRSFHATDRRSPSDIPLPPPMPSSSVRGKIPA